jgi:hypothetical protein
MHFIEFVPFTEFERCALKSQTRLCRHGAELLHAGRQCAVSETFSISSSSPEHRELKAFRDMLR